MKKLSVLLILLLTISLVSALKIEMKDTFDQDELLTAKISGDIIQPPLKQNIFLKRGHVRVGLDASVGKIGDDYYIFASLAGKTANNYTLIIEDVEYKRGSATIVEDLVKNFTITENLTDFSLNKGFVITKDHFNIELYNFLDDDLQVEMQIETIVGEEGGITSYSENEKHDFVIGPGSEIINFQVGAIQEPTIKIINFSSTQEIIEEGLFGDTTSTEPLTTYSIPVYIYVDDTSEHTKIHAFEIFCQDCDDIKLPVGGEEKLKVVYIYNQGTGTLTNVRLTLSESFTPYIILSEDYFEKILPNSNANLNMTIQAGAEKTISGRLFVETSEGVSDSIQIAIDVKEGYEDVEETPVLTSLKPCSELGGKICKKDVEECRESTKETILAKDGQCCFGSCVPTSASPAGKIIGWSILIILLGVGAWFFLKKYRNIKAPVDLLKTAQPKN